MRNFGKKQPGVSDAHSAGGQVINGGSAWLRVRSPVHPQRVARVSASPWARLRGTARAREAARGRRPAQRRLQPVTSLEGVAPKRADPSYERPMRSRARAAKIFIKAKLVKGLHGIGCTISEQGVITAIEPNGVVATRGELALGDKIVEVNKMPVQFGSIHETLSKGCLLYTSPSPRD